MKQHGCVTEGWQATKVYVPALNNIQLRLDAICRSNELACLVVPNWSHSWKPKLMRITLGCLDLGAVHDVIGRTEWQWPAGWRMVAHLVQGSWTPVEE